MESYETALPQLEPECWKYIFRAGVGEYLPASKSIDGASAYLAGWISITQLAQRNPEALEALQRGQADRLKHHSQTAARA